MPNERDFAFSEDETMTNTKIQIIGANGSMGTRYQAILRKFGCDSGDHVDLDKGAIDFDCRNFIICTSTDIHFDVLQGLPIGSRVLCEKPLAKSSQTVREMLNYADQSLIDLQMVLQYVELFDERMLRRMDSLLRNASVRSYYDYFRHGNDGLVWDCLQIIALSQCPVSLSESSPIWQCMINGIELTAGAAMDIAYCEHVQNWIEHNPPKFFRKENSHQNYQSWLIDIHRKAEEMAACQLSR
jgi:hypothetical protein